jgi:uncharacterized protein
MQEKYSNKNYKEVVQGYIHFATSPSDSTYLIGSKCELCGYVAFPKRSVCPNCVKGDTMKEIPLSGKGKLHSFSIAHIAPPGLTAPYLVAWVNLDEGPRIFSQITGCEIDEKALQIGQRLEFVVDKISIDEKGNELIGYKFRPV